jgi:hypothetical protein
MPVISTILTKLPVKIRAQLEKRLTEKTFHSYEDLSQWLSGLGYEISKHTIHRYARRFKPQAAAITFATAQARAVAKASPGEEGMMIEALKRLLHQKLFTTLFENSEGLDQADLMRLAKTIGELSRATIDEQRAQAEAQDLLERPPRSAQEKLSALEGAGGLSKSAANQIRDLLLGINPFAAKTSLVGDPED